MNQMLNPSQISETIVNSLLEIEPNFKVKWEDHRGFWKGEKSGEYSDLAVVAHYIVDSAAIGNTQSFSQFFQSVEVLLDKADHSSKELIAVGLFEDIQNISSHVPIEDEVFSSHLGPKSIQLWQEIRDIWKDKDSLAEVIRSERKKS